MKNYLLLFLVLIFAILQVSFLPVNLVLLVVLAFALLNESSRSLLFAFYAGLILDLAKGGPLGFYSIFFLVVVFVLLLYSNRFEVSRWFFIPIFIFLVSVIENLFKVHFFVWKEGLILAFVWFLRITLMPERNKDFKLKV